MENKKLQTRRSFLIAGAAAAGGLMGLRWVFSQPDADGIPWPLRKVLNFNENVWRRYYSNESAAPRPTPPAKGTHARKNGDIGLNSDFELSRWRLHISSPPNDDLTVAMEELKRLPKTETSTDFKCIEGWSQNISYAGIKFTDFMDHYHIGMNDRNIPYHYVGLETPDEEYYVSVDMASMMHPQTILAYELNGEPLTPEHGAPLRLIIPVKYGIKHLKRIGRIYFSDDRPPDYWTERGYDWYSGL